MHIKGMQKTSLLDFPGKMATVVFLGGCNMRCVFCHNSALACHPETEPDVSEDELFNHLRRRKNMLEGVVITGGEPTLSPGLGDFILKIKDETGLPVKLDTNGLNPKKLEGLLPIVDYVAMDIKSDLEGYPGITQVPGIDTGAIQWSIDLLISGGVPYEFRTTVVREYHNPAVFENIAGMLDGAERYYLQSFRMCDNVLSKGVPLHSCTKEEMLGFQRILEPHVGYVGLRGVD